MTLSTSAPRNEYTATASQAVFNYTFKIYSSSDLNVYLTPVGSEANDLADITTSYVIDSGTIGDEGGGFLTLNTGVAAGTLVTVVSAIPFNRTTDYQVNGDFKPDVVNADFDRAVSLSKQTSFTRGLKFEEALQGQEDLTLPAPDSQKLMRWKGDLSGLENVSLSVIDPDVVFLQDLIKSYSSVGALLNDSEIAVGQAVRTVGYHAAGVGAADYSIVTQVEFGGIPDEKGDLTLANGLVAVLYKGGAVFATQYGVVGGNETLDTSGMQAAMDANLHVLVPTPATPYIFANLTPNRGQTIEGDSQFDGGAGTTSIFTGNGSDPVFLCGDGGTTPLREITFKSLNGDGNTQEVILGRTSPNMKVRDCWFRTTSATKNTIDLELCFRSEISKNKLSCSGGAWALQGIDNFNGCQVENNIITGGSLGGAINIGFAAGCKVTGNTIETSLKGIFLAADSQVGNGNVDGIEVDGNYVEDCPVPFSFGEQFSVLGLSGGGNFVGNTGLSLTPDSVVKWGRVFYSTFSNNSFEVNAGETVYNLVLNQATGDQEGNTLGNDAIGGTPANLYVLSGSQAASGSVQRVVGWQNYYPFLNDISRPHSVVFESGIITANIGQANLAFNDFNPLVLGGKITKVEVIEKNGVITSTLAVGRSGSAAEVVSVDPETLTFNDGRADATLLTANATLRSSESATYRIIVGVGTGTFRVRITYKAS